MSYAVWSPAFTGINKGTIFLCIPDAAQGAVSEIALECCDDCQVKQTQDRDGIHGPTLDLDIWADKTKILQMSWDIIKDKEEL